MDDAKVQLLQTMAQNPGAARSMLQSLLAERAAADPTLGMVMQLMSARQSDDDGDDDPPAVAVAADPRRQARVRRVRERVQEMREELLELHERNEQLAAALGACPVCWGRSRTCEECGGDGTPGWVAPDPALFNELVAPVIARLRRVRSQEPSTGREQ